MEELHCLFNTAGLRVFYDPLNKWLYNQWLGEHTASSIVAGAEAIAHCLSTQPCTKILSDHSQLCGAWMGAALFVGQQGLARLAGQGIVYFAWVYSPSQISRAAMDQALLYAPTPAISTFDNVADAYEWLRRLPISPVA
jgi:hypothetical protein